MLAGDLRAIGEGATVQIRTACRGSKPSVSLELFAYSSDLVCHFTSGSESSAWIVVD